jgi:hypothetical protein
MNLSVEDIVTQIRQQNLQNEVLFCLLTEIIAKDPENEHVVRNNDGEILASVLPIKMRTSLVTQLLPDPPASITPYDDANSIISKLDDLQNP